MSTKFISNPLIGLKSSAQHIFTYIIITIYAFNLSGAVVYRSALEDLVLTTLEIIGATINNFADQSAEKMYHYNI